MKTCKSDENNIKYVPKLQQYFVIPDIEIIEKIYNFAQNILKMTSLPVPHFYLILTSHRKYIVLTLKHIFAALELGSGENFPICFSDFQ